MSKHPYPGVSVGDSLPALIRQARRFYRHKNCFTYDYKADTYYKDREYTTSYV